MKGPIINTVIEDKSVKDDFTYIYEKILYIHTHLTIDQYIRKNLEQCSVLKFTIII